MAKNPDSKDDKPAVKVGVQGGTGRTWHILSVDDLPPVPDDQEQVLADVTPSLRRFPEASYTEGVNGLKEVAERGQSHPGELGDLVAPTARAGASAAVLERSRAVVARLEALAAYHRAVLAHEENASNVMMDDYEAEATRRIAKARIPPEAYPNLRKFVAARGEVIARGKAQAKALQEARSAPRPDAVKNPTDGAAKPDVTE